MKNILNKPWIVLAAGVLVVGGVIAAQNLKTGARIFPGNVVRLQPAGLNTGADLTMLRNLDATFSALSEAASQAAVYIVDAKASGSGTAMSQLQGSKSGSGFIYRSDGWIVTNDHVVSGSDTVKVILADGRELTGKVTHANDPQLDLAVVKVDATDLPSLAFCDSSKARVGQFVLAIGAPFGLEDSVTIGHLSAFSRQADIMDPTTGERRVYSGLIQTDASVNPGNSGGPLINIDGDVLGINSAINSPSGANAGIAFAIPSNVAKSVVDELIATGKFDRGMLGVAPRDLKPFEKKKLNLKGGAYSDNVEAGSPADKAGIKKGDIITSIDSLPIDGELDVRIAMYKHSPKQTASVTYLRDGQSKSATVTLEAPKAIPAQKRQNLSPNGQGFPFQYFDQDPNQGEQADPAPQTEQSGKPKLGVSVQQIDSNARQQFSLPGDASGVVVTTVADGSFASKVNLSAGDVITSINGKPVATVSDLTDAMAGVNWGDQVQLKFLRYKNGAKSEYSVSVPFK